MKATEHYYLSKIASLEEKLRAAHSPNLGDDGRLQRIRLLHHVTTEIADWNETGEALCDACMVPFPCRTTQLLDEALGPIDHVDQ